MNKFLDYYKNFYMQRRFSSLTTPNPPKELKMFDNFYSAKKIEVELCENQMLFIPAGWFHMVVSEKDDKYGINCAMSFFTKYDGCSDCDIDINKEYNLDIGNEKDNTIDYKNYIKKSLPCIIHPTKTYNDYITPENLKIYIKGPQYILKSDDENFFANDYIKNLYPEFCKFEKMTVEDFFNQEIKTGYLTLDGSKPKDFNIPRPDFTKNEIEKNFSLLLNFGGGIHGALHYDTNNNTLLQLRGKKRIYLFPPSERNKLHLVNPLNTKFLCAFNKILQNL